MIDLEKFIVIYVEVNDGIVEGVKYRDYFVFSVQFYLDVVFGLYDVLYLFDEFMEMMDVGKEQ